MLKFHKTIPVLFVLSCYASYADAVIDAYITSAARTEQSALTTPASITIITREEIESSGARHVVDLLQGRGGVHVSDSYGDGSRSSVGMRGFGDTANANTLILVDGRRLNNMDIASPDLNSIALEDVERVEIVQGSAGVLFGDQAVGGVINIITRKSGALKHSLKLSAGSYGAVGFHGMTSQTLDNGFNYSVSLDARESDNYRRHNETSYLNGFGKLGYNYDSGSVFAELQYIDDELNAPGALFENDVITDRRQVLSTYVGDFSDAETTAGRFGLKQEMGDNWSFEGELTSRDTDGVFRLSSVPVPETQNSTQNRQVKEFTPRFIGLIPDMSNVLLTLGADMTDSDYALSSRFGDQFNDQSLRSLYAQAVVSATEKMDVTVGMRYASVDNKLRDTGMFALYPTGIQIDDEVTVGTLGLAFKANESWRVLLRADQNYRFAKVDEFLQPAYTPMFTPILLKTQEGLSIETGVEWNHESHSAKLIVYKLEIDNEIAYDPVNFANINLDKTERNGLITEGYWKINDRLGVAISYTLTDAEIINGAFAGKSLPLVAEHSGFVSGNYRINNRWQIYGEIQAVGDRVFSGDFDNVLNNLPGYGVTNLKVEYDLKDFVLSGRINNLFDKQYSEFGTSAYNPFPTQVGSFFPSPERNFLLTASWKFK